MPLVINTNFAAINAQRQLGLSTVALNKAMEKLSSGLRINRASDDVGGLGVAEILRARWRSFTVAARNANDGISLVGVAEGSMEVMAGHLIRMRELAEQASSGTLSDTQRSALQSEFSNLQSEIDRIAETTKFNGINVISASGTTISFQVGVESGSNNVINLSSIKDEKFKNITLAKLTALESRLKEFLTN